MKIYNAAKRAASTILCLALVSFLFPAASFAAVRIAVYVTDTTAPIYRYMNTSSASLGRLSFGQKLYCTDVSGNWARVENEGGKTGYMKKNDLSTKNPNTLDKKVYIQENDVKVYAHASTSSKKIATLQAGEKFTAVAKSGSWLRIKNGKYYGYVKTADTGSEYNKGTKVYMTDRLITVTSKPGEFDSIGSISYGQSCYLLEKKSSYVKVRSAGGKVGYINATNCLSTKDPCTLNKTMYVQADNMGYYKSAILKDRVGSLDKNDAVTVVGRSPEGWYRVKINGKYYYMLDIILDESKAPAQGRTYYANELCSHIYERPNLSADKVASVKKGDKLILIGCKGSGLKVKNEDGKVGYVLSSELSKTK